MSGATRAAVNPDISNGSTSARSQALAETFSFVNLVRGRVTGSDDS